MRRRSATELATEPGACGEGLAARVIVFCMFKKEAAEVARQLISRGYSATAIQGNMGQHARELALQRFRDGAVEILVATDVAARGLDVQDVTHVINYSVGLSIDMYVHRVGRCGRAGRAGLSHTFVLDSDKKFAGPLIDLMQRNQQIVPRELYRIAQENHENSSTHNHTHSD